MTLADSIEKFIAPLRRRLQLVVSRGVIKRVTDSRGIQTAQAELHKDEIREGLERFQSFGLTSVPKAGSEIVVVFVNGNRDHGFIVGTEDRTLRPKNLAEGETCLYNAAGIKALLKANKNLEITGIEKFKVANGSNELMAVLVELVQAIIDARVATSMGPQPLLNAGNPFPGIKTKLESFKA